MKLQKRLSHTYNYKKYSKWIIALSEDDVHYSGFKEGYEMEVDSKKGKILLWKERII